jgi:phosphoribosyl-AMP cyclohydrolase
MTDRTIQDTDALSQLSFWENGLLPVVAQDASTGTVLMVAFANREALERTLTTGQMHYWSRSRQELWHKGATSFPAGALAQGSHLGKLSGSGFPSCGL